MKINRAGSAGAILCLVFAAGLVQAASLTWTIKITPAGGGVVAWKCDSPAASGTLTASGKITVNKDAFVDLTFTSNLDHTLVMVTKGGTDWTPYLDAQYHYQFGPVGEAESFIVVFSGGSTGPISPTGLFSITYPTGTTNLTPIMDVTGNYTGVGNKGRAYNVDVAQDEFGKVSGIGTVQGITTDTGSTTLAGTAGSIKTVNYQPYASGRGKVSGNIDGTPSECSVSGSSNLVPQTSAASTILPVTLTYKGKNGDVPKEGTDALMQVPVNPTQTATNMKKAWNIEINISQMTFGTKTALGAWAVLTLPNGEQTYYLGKRTRYSVKNGYSLSFKGGTNISVTPSVKDKVSAVTIKKMTLTQSGTAWTITGGTIAYKFMGQKGQGNLLDFLVQ